MEQGLIDIRNKAREKSKKFGKWSPYEISCETLIAILNDLEAAQQSVQADLLPCGHSVDNLGGFGGCNPNGSCMACAAISR
jgi:hypothetical protein